MFPARPKTATGLIRLSLLAGLAGLAAISLPDRGASLMHAWPGRYFFYAAVFAAPLALLFRASLSPDPLHLPSPAWSGLAAGTAVTLLAAALFSPYRATAVLWTATPLAGLAGFFLLHDWLQADPANRARLPGLAAVAAGVLMLASAAYTIADVCQLSRTELFSARLFDMRNGHPLGHTSYTAGLALLGLPWLAQAAWERRGGRRAVAIIGLGLGLLVLFTSGSRGGLIGLAALGVVALVGARAGGKRTLLLAGAAVVAALVFAAANPRIRSLLGPTDPGAALSISNLQRKAMLQAGLRMGADRPGLGWGLGTTPLVYPRYRAQLDGGVENVLQLHSTPVEIWAGLGAAGLIAAGAFLLLGAGGWKRAPTAATTLAGYSVFALTDYQFDVPLFAFAMAALAAQLAAPDAAPAGPRARALLVAAIVSVLGVGVAFGRNDPTPAINAEALILAREPAQAARAAARFEESLALNPDQEIAHFNLGWLLLVRDPATAERHFRAAARLVPDKGGVYFGLGLARLNQGNVAGAARGFALECLNDPRFLASPWWNEPAIAAVREPTRADFSALGAQALAALPAGTWTARQAVLLTGLAPRLGTVSPGPERTYRRERTGYPVLMRNLDLPPPVDLFDVREDPRFAASVGFALPPKGWLPAPLLLKLLDEGAPAGHK